MYKKGEIYTVSFYFLLQPIKKPKDATDEETPRTFFEKFSIWLLFVVYIYNLYVIQPLPNLNAFLFLISSVLGITTSFYVTFVANNWILKKASSLLTLFDKLSPSCTRVLFIFKSTYKQQGSVLRYLIVGVILTMVLISFLLIPPQNGSTNSDNAYAELWGTMSFSDFKGLNGFNMWECYP